jgi:uroporphyrinogen III methyltransferase / synthase
LDDNRAMRTQVYLIGAGPGDPGLLTLRAVDRLGRCDVVLYDGLANPEILAHAPQAEHISVGKHGQSRIWTQTEIIAEMLSHARAGRTVARLKGGDPAVFARTAEEVDALVDAGILFEIIPGITAALAAGSFAGIPITHRGLASAVALVTGHEEPEKTQTALDWDALARFPGTLVIYMGVTTAQTWTSALIASGKDPATPCAIVRRCSLPDQQQIHCRLDEVVSHLIPASKFRPPVITIVGLVTELATSMHWLAKRPLFGKTVLVTRPTAQADGLDQPLIDAGARVLHQPAIEISWLDETTPQHHRSLDEIIDRFDEFDTIVFCSVNGVDGFIPRYLRRNEDQSGRRDLRRWANKSIGVVGAKTAEALCPYYLSADYVPDDFRSESFVKQFASALKDKRVLVVRASRGRDVLATELAAAGIHVEQVVAYEHRDVSVADATIVAAIDQDQVDWITITSTATAENLHRLLGDQMHRLKIASLSPVTSEAIRQLGYTVSAQADPYTMESLVQSIVDFEKSNQG